MPVPSTMAELNTTANSNSPAGTESPSNADDFLRAIQAIVRTTNAKGADIASAATTDIGAATGEFVDVTGTTTITGLGTIAAGIVRTVRFTGALTLTHNATSLILPGGANITTANGDVAMFRSLGSGNWKCVFYEKADGRPLVFPSINGLTTVTIDPINDLFAISDASDGGSAKNALLPKGMVLLATYTASASAQIDITQGFDGNYAYLEFVFEGIIPATNAVNLQARVSTDGGSSFISTATYFTSTIGNNAAAASAGTADSQTQWSINAGTTISNLSGEGVYGRLQLFNPAVAGGRGYMTSHIHYRFSASDNAVVLRGNFTTNGTINAIRFFMSSGNIASGKIYVYGVRK